MPRARSPERDLAYKLWLDSGKTRELKDIADELGVSAEQVRKWKSQDKWGLGNVPKQKGTKSNVTKHVTKTKVMKSNVTKQEAEKSSARIVLNDELTEKQKLFCVYFSKTFNATSAYQKAYGCSYVAAMSSASTLLRNPKIRDEITRLKQERYAQALLSPGDIFQKYMDIAFADAGDLMSWGREERTFIELDEDGNETPVRRKINVVRLKESHEIDTTLVNEVKQGRDGVTVKLPDRMKALEWLADHMDLATPEQKARTEKIIAETEKLRAGQGSDDDDMVLRFVEGMKHDKADPEAD